MKTRIFVLVLISMFLCGGNAMAKIKGDFCWSLTDQTGETSVRELKLNVYNAGANHYFCSGLVLEDALEIMVVSGTVESVNDLVWITTSASGEKDELFWVSTGKISLDPSLNGTWKDVEIVDGQIGYKTYDMTLIDCQ